MMLLIALAILLETGAADPVRAGPGSARDGRPFRMYKFRKFAPDGESAHGCPVTVQGDTPDDAGRARPGSDEAGRAAAVLQHPARRHGHRRAASRKPGLRGLLRGPVPRRCSTTGPACSARARWPSATRPSSIPKAPIRPSSTGACCSRRRRGWTSPISRSEACVGDLGWFLRGTVAVLCPRAEAVVRRRPRRRAQAIRRSRPGGVDGKSEEGHRKNEDSASRIPPTPDAMSLSPGPTASSART